MVNFFQDETHNKKTMYLSLRLSRLGQGVDPNIKNINTIPPEGTTRVVKSLSLNGYKLNIAERFGIANGILDLGKLIENLSTNKREKYQLLSFILGCDVDTAKDVLNQTYRKDVRYNDEAVKSYIDKFNIVKKG